MTNYYYTDCIITDKRIRTPNSSQLLRIINSIIFLGEKYPNKTKLSVALVTP